MRCRITLDCFNGCLAVSQGLHEGCRTHEWPPTNVPSVLVQLLYEHPNDFSESFRTLKPNHYIADRFGHGVLLFRCKHAFHQLDIHKWHLVFLSDWECTHADMPQGTRCKTTRSCDFRTPQDR